jgi:DNA-binding NarL/FixJ family response regulator
MEGDVAPGSAVAVADRIPLVRSGLVATLTEHGIRAAEFSEAMAAEPYTALIVAVRDNADRAFVLAFGKMQPSAPVIAILPDPTPHAYAEVLRLGAQAAVGDAEPVDELVAVVEAALEGRTRLPAEIVRLLAEGRCVGPCVPPLSEEEAGWLRGLAAGVTVAALAERAAYSERELYRRLARLYSRLGVRGRAEAVVLATKWGIVE